MVRKHSSVWMLLCRFTVWKVLAVILAAGGVQAVLFGAAMHRELAYAQQGLSQPALETVIERSRISWAAGAGFLLCTAILCAAGCSFGSKCGYTLQRLSVSEKGLFVWQSVHNALCFLVFWASQAGVAVLLCLWFSKEAEAYSTGQAVFLAFYRSDFLHALLPLEDLFLWVRGLILCAGLGASAAVFPYRHREGKFGWEILAASCAVLLWFDNGLGGYALDVLLLLCILCTAGEAVHYVIVSGKEEL